MTVVIKRLQVSAGSAQTLKVGAAPKGFFPNVSHNDNLVGMTVPPVSSPLTAAYDALAQESFLSLPADDKSSWSLDWY